MIEEKDILAGEVVKLQERINQESDHFLSSSGINHYNPNNPDVLQKRIGKHANKYVCSNNSNKILKLD